MKNNEWINFKDQMPTEELGGQVQILFGHPKWSTFIRGMYTNFPDKTLGGRLMEYDSINDKYYEWVSKVPTVFMLLPDNPE